ncbi:hypothetical protein [Tenacibaculum sp. M341]|uniref:hypothetical protein n=1 Tax=Tenacibaculum sp. M341 TaxID=2530339 RepID=UPI001044CE83|nr:hypothetical protein [Tenacibaculum sp. M341]TCI85305.1 hypothetical protein EYW44_17170 [Tenacibaculum sp. M341]
MKKSKKELKTFFETGDIPTEEQFSDLIDSYIDAQQPKGVANRRFVIDENGEVTLTSENNGAEYDLTLSNNRLYFLKDAKVIKQIDLTPYLDDTNLARLTSGTLNNTTGIATFKRDDNSTFTIDFSSLTNSVSASNGLNVNSTGEVVLGGKMQENTYVDVTDNSISFLNYGTARGFSITADGFDAGGSRHRIVNSGNVDVFTDDLKIRTATNTNDDASISIRTAPNNNPRFSNGTLEILSKSGGLLLNQADSLQSDKVNLLNASNAKAFRYHVNGTLKITEDNDIPNKKYVDDAVKTPPNIATIFTSGVLSSGQNSEVLLEDDAQIIIGEQGNFGLRINGPDGENSVQLSSEGNPLELKAKLASVLLQSDQKIDYTAEGFHNFNSFGNTILSVRDNGAILPYTSIEDINLLGNGAVVHKQYVDDAITSTLETINTFTASNGLSIGNNHSIKLGGVLDSHTTVEVNPNSTFSFTSSENSGDRLSIGNGLSANIDGFNITSKNIINMHAASHIVLRSTSDSQVTLETGSGDGLLLNRIAENNVDRINELSIGSDKNGRAWRYRSVSDDPIAILEDNDIPNKKYIDDAIASINTSGDSSSGTTINESFGDLSFSAPVTFNGLTGNYSGSYYRIGGLVSFEVVCEMSGLCDRNNSYYLYQKTLPYKPVNSNGSFSLSFDSASITNSKAEVTIQAVHFGTNQIWLGLINTSDNSPQEWNGTNLSSSTKIIISGTYYTNDPF